MRPTSVIFLIISVLIACLGLMLCLGAQSMAEKEGIELFASVEQEDGSYVITKYFGLAEGEESDPSSNKNDTKKMELNFENVDVLIKGGSDVNKIEFINFTEGMYSYKASVGGALTIEDLNGVMKMISFGSSGINFKGFRNLLFYRDYGKLERSVVIYLSPESNVNNIICSVKGGNITVENTQKPIDFTLTAKEGEISLSGIHENSTISLTNESGAISVKNSKLYDMTITGGTCSVDISKTSLLKSLSVSVENGDVNYIHEGDTFDGFDVDVNALDGILTVNGTPLLVPNFTYDGAPDEDPNKAPDEEGEEGEEDEDEEEETSSYVENSYVPNSIKITSKKGNVTVNNATPTAVGGNQ